MESILFQILTDIFAPFLLAFSISFGILRKIFDEKAATLIAFVFAMLFLYYQNTKPPIFSSFIAYTLVTMVILLMGTAIILGKKLTPKIAVGIFFITIFAMALYTVIPIQIEEETFTNITITIKKIKKIPISIDIIDLLLILVIIGVIYFMRKKKENKKSLEDICKELTGICKNVTDICKNITDIFKKKNNKK